MSIQVLVVVAAIQIRNIYGYQIKLQRAQLQNSCKSHLHSKTVCLLRLYIENLDHKMWWRECVKEDWQTKFVADQDIFHEGMRNDVMITYGPKSRKLRIGLNYALNRADNM